MGDVRIECCVDSIQAAELALDGGADRLEVCSRLSQGGYTPGCELLGAVLKLQKRGYPGCQVFAMVRPWCDVEEIVRYQVVASERGISMLPGSGILPENAVGVVRGTGCREVHRSFGGGSLVAAVRGKLNKRVREKRLDCTS